MKNYAWLKLFYVGFAVLTLAGSVGAQQHLKPLIVRRYRTEVKRDVKLEAAIIAALYGDNESGVNRDRARYLYNRVDLNGDGQTESIVYVFGPTWCGSAGCVALIFQSIDGGYKLVTHISGVENPVIVSLHRTNNWNDLISHVRWGEVGEQVVRDYYAVLRFDGMTYPDQFPGAPPIERQASGVAYLNNSPSSASGLPLKLGTVHQHR